MKKLILISHLCHQWGSLTPEGCKKQQSDRGKLSQWSSHMLNRCVMVKDIGGNVEDWTCAKQTITDAKIKPRENPEIILQMINPRATKPPTERIPLMKEKSLRAIKTVAVIPPSNKSVIKPAVGIRPLPPNMVAIRRRHIFLFFKKIWSLNHQCPLL